MIVCLAGMHRSGTSLFSSYLERCGIAMGKEMVSATRGNPRGHFEDLDFVTLHDQILADNKCHMYSPRIHLTVSATRRNAAMEILASHNTASPVWGWKDPRTTLFLELWNELAPEIRFILLYRHPEAVADSMLRRGTDRRLLVMPWLPYHAWLSYNTRLLEFYNAHRDKCLLLNIQGVNNQQDKAEKLISDFLSIRLPEKYSSVYEPKELSGNRTEKKPFIHQMVSACYRKRMNTLYHALEQAAALPGKAPVA